MKKMVLMCVAIIFFTLATGLQTAQGVIPDDVPVYPDDMPLYAPAPLPTIATTFESALFAAMPSDENYMVSPFSLRMALAMAANGASGRSQAELLAALGIADLHAFNQAAAAFIADANENEAVTLNIANSIWFNEDYFKYPCLDFSPAYQRIIADYFAGMAQRVNAHDGADIINGWIAQQTNDRIRDVVDPLEEALALLVNAIYFQGNWAQPFNPAWTTDGIFTDRHGVETTLPFMQQTRWFSFYHSRYFQMLAKPYVDENIRMYLVLPNPRIYERLHFDLFTDAIDRMQYREVRLRLPRFTTEFTHDNLVEILQDMGVEQAFEQNRLDSEEFNFDFVGYHNMMYPPIVHNEYLFVWIDNILQKAFIEVDETGTEAAAVTVVEMRGAVAISICPLPPPIPFYCNRPFIYFIRNDATGDILFMGEFAFAE